MLRLVVDRYDPDLKFPLFADNFLCLVHIDTGKFHPDILGYVVEAAQDIHFGILGTKRIDLVFKDEFDIIGSCLGDSRLETGDLPAIGCHNGHQFSL